MTLPTQIYSCSTVESLQIALQNLRPHDAPSDEEQFRGSSGASSCSVTSFKSLQAHEVALFFLDRTLEFGKHNFFLDLSGNQQL